MENAMSSTILIPPIDRTLTDGLGDFVQRASSFLQLNYDIPLNANEMVPQNITPLNAIGTEVIDNTTRQSSVLTSTIAPNSTVPIYDVTNSVFLHLVKPIDTFAPITGHSLGDYFDDITNILPDATMVDIPISSYLGICSDQHSLNAIAATFDDIELDVAVSQQSIEKTSVVTNTIEYDAPSCSYTVASRTNDNRHVADTHVTNVMTTLQVTSAIENAPNRIVCDVTNTATAVPKRNTTSADFSEISRRLALAGTTIAMEIPSTDGLVIDLTTDEDEIHRVLNETVPNDVVKDALLLDDTFIDF